MRTSHSTSDFLLESPMRTNESGANRLIVRRRSELASVPYAYAIASRTADPKPVRMFLLTESIHRRVAVSGFHVTHSSDGFLLPSARMRLSTSLPNGLGMPPISARRGSG